VPNAVARLAPPHGRCYTAPRQRGCMKPLFTAVAFALSVPAWLGCSSNDSPGGVSGGGSATTGGTTTNGGQGAGGGQQSTGGTTTASTRKVPGDPCTADSQCSGLTTLAGVCMTSWPGGGYCTTEACNGSTQCANLGWCGDDGTGTKRCLLFCNGTTTCKTGYTCSGANVCVPS